MIPLVAVMRRSGTGRADIRDGLAKVCDGAFALWDGKPAELG